MYIFQDEKCRLMRNLLLSIENTCQHFQYNLCLDEGFNDLKLEKNLF